MAKTPKIRGGNILTNLRGRGQRKNRSNFLPNPDFIEFFGSLFEVYFENRDVEVVGGFPVIHILVDCANKFPVHQNLYGILRSFAFLEGDS